MTIFQSTEKYYKEQSLARLEVLIERYGVSMRIYRPAQDKSRTVYGSAAGTVQAEPLTTISGILTGDAFFPSDNVSTGGFEEGFLYTVSGDVRSGDTLEVIRDDQLRLKYKVGAVEDIGTTTQVFRRYKISSLGD